MKTIGNVLWLVFGGVEAALQYFLGGCLLMLTIVGIPFGRQAWKIGFFILWPFGSKVVSPFGHQHFKMARLALNPFGKDVQVQ